MSDKKISGNEMEILNDTSKYLKNICEQLPSIIENVRNIRNLDDIPEIANKLFIIVRAFDATKNIHNIQYDINSIKEIVSDVLEAVQNKDFSLIADIFEFDIMPLTMDWNENLCNFLENND